MSFASIKDQVRARLRRHVLSRSGALARRMIYADPRRSPARLPVIDVSRDSGLGDVLMLTPALRELKRVNPGGRIRFYTDFGDAVSGLPYIDEVLPYAARPPNALFVEYTDIVPSPVHLAQLMGDRLDVRVTNMQPDCTVDQGFAEGYRRAWAHLPRPHIIVLRRASRFTPNKDWPEESWSILIDRLCQAAAVIEVGTARIGGVASPSPTYLDLRGETSLKQLIAAIAAADLYVGPVSGPLHVAAAVRIPAVAVIGGYEHPVNAHYEGNVELYTALPCAPCWLREPCPFDLKCLRAITPDDVAGAVWRVWQASAGAARKTSLVPA